MILWLKLNLIQFALLALGVILMEEFHLASLYDFAYMLSFLIPVFLLTETNSDLRPYVIPFASCYFLIWLFTLPVIHCLYFANGSNCAGALGPAQCKIWPTCVIQSVHYAYGQQISQIGMRGFLNDDSIIQAVLDSVPYAIDKVILWGFGINWLTVCLDIIVMFSVHSSIALTWLIFAG